MVAHKIQDLDTSGSGGKGRLPYKLSGLRIDTDNLPWFNRNEQNFNANYNWQNNRFHNTSLVGFRDCSTTFGCYKDDPCSSLLI